MFIKHHAMKAYTEVEALLHAYLTSALDGDEWSSSWPGDRAPDTRWIEGRVHPFGRPQSERNPDPPAVWPVARSQYRLLNPMIT